MNAIHQTLAILDQQRRPPFDVFCESWISEAELTRATQNARANMRTFTGVASYIGAMICAGGWPRVTEDALAFRLSGVAMKEQQRLMSLPGVRTIPSFENAIIHRRDRLVAAHLNKKVKKNGVAVLCMGAAHDVPAYLTDEWIYIVISPEEVVDVAILQGYANTAWLKRHYDQVAALEVMGNA